MREAFPKRPMIGGTHDGTRPDFFDYWRVGYGSAEELALEFWVEQAGVYHTKPKHHYPMYEYQLRRWRRVYYLAEGEGECVFSSHTMSVKAGDLFVVPTYHPFMYQCEKRSVYHFLAMVGRWVPVWREPERILHFRLGIQPEVEAGFVAIREALILQQPGYPLQALGHFYHVMAKVEGKKGGKMPASPLPDSVRNALIYLEENCTRPFLASELAKQLHLSPSHIRALFEKWVGESPKRYHTRCRMDLAKQLLREQQMPVQMVAAHVGFNDVGYFSRVFRQTTGKAPSHYAKADV